MKSVTSSRKHMISTTQVFGSWETLVFNLHSNGEVDWHEIDGNKYSSYDEAVMGHNELVQKWEGKD